MIPTPMDSVAKALLETIGSAGFAVYVSANELAAIDKHTGERFIVRFGADYFYDAVFHLAEQVGVDLEDG